MIHVIKADGKSEPFNEEKVLSSIARAGIPENARLQVLREIKSHIYDKIPSSEIYSRILDALGNTSHPYSKSKYGLKQAIMMLGPTGYPFEDFISKVLMTEGYQTRVRQTLWGKCVSHEVDVIAEKDNKISMIEAKFHNNPGTRSEVHVALYTQARFQDIKEKYHIDEAWIVTNTKTTTDAIAYAECMGMKIISWSYPIGNSLRDMIEKSHLHPITMVTSISSLQKMELLKNHIVMCKDLLTNPSYLDTFAFTKQEKDKILKELDFICNFPV